MENKNIETIATKKRAVSISRIFSVIASVGVIMSLLCVNAFAVDADQAIITGIAGGLGKAFKIIRAVVIPVAAIYIAVQAFRGLTGGTKAGENIKTGIIVAIIAILLVSLAPTLAAAISNWTTSDGTGVFSNIDAPVTGA